ncbi:MAG: threonylcarbamoyl-AMP synthase [Candidatus Cloacimonadota bacterium]|nr:MAG: threonylcarbamoyl-AMP synthase [Candidatus Cloacimonadota bacterium]
MKKKIYNTDKKGIEEAISVLKKGGIIAFPTDTVYGIGGDAYDKSAVTKIFRIKRRKREKPLVIFLSQNKQLNKFVRNLSKTRKKVYEHFLPGEITLIMKAKKSVPPWLISREKTISVRIPDSNFLKKLLVGFKNPLVTTSANISGEPPASKYRNINLDVNLILRDDSFPSGTPSTILDMSLYPFVLRRKGTISVFNLERYIPSKVRFDKSIVFNVLFVCTGNSCRSPIAEGILKKFLKEKGLKNVYVSSCGILAGDGWLPTENAVLSASEQGSDIRSHRSRAINREMAEDADLILCMETFHKKRVNSLLPEGKDKVFLLSEFAGKSGGINDPIGGDMQIYRKVTREIKRHIKGVADNIERRFRTAIIKK